MNAPSTLYQVSCFICVASFGATMLGLLLTTLVRRRRSSVHDRILQVGFTAALTTAVVVSVAFAR
jgi:uncharacterized membrane protein